MKWTVKLEKKPDLRILAIYEPFSKKIIFNGMHKQKNMQWECLAVREYDYTEELFEDIDNILFAVYEDVSAVLENVKTIDAVFDKIKLIEINENDLSQE